MSILRYLQKTKEKDECDSPEFTIAKELVNEQIQVENDEGKGTPRKRQTSGKRGTYVSYTPEQRRDIGKYAAEHGNSKAVKKFSEDLNCKISESTVRNIKSAYLKEIHSPKRKLNLDESEVLELTPKKRGRKLMLGDELDENVKKMVNSVRNSGGVINSAIVMAAGKGIVLAKDRSLLVENGGHIGITKSWAQSFLRRMGMVKRKGTTSKKIFNVENFENEKDKFLTDVRNKMENNDIPKQLVINWDQTGINIVPVSQWTMEVEGAKRVEIQGIDDKRQITGM